VLVEKLCFFHDDRSRLNEVEYRVKSRVPSEIFRDFVSSIEGKPIKVAEQTFPFLRALSEELGFEALFAECDSFKESHGSTCEDCRSAHNSKLERLTESRVLELEEC
jgi:hypothetical protein